MSKSMLINVILEEESRVAIVDNGILDFFEIETLTKETLKGNIYKGVVDNVNGSLDAAFVDCGWERPGFLPLDEVNFKVLPPMKGRKGASRIQEHVAPGMEILVQVIRDKFGTKPPSLSTYYSLPGRYLVLMPYTDSSGVSRRIEDEKERVKLKKLLEDLQPPEKFGFIVRTAGLDQSRRELIRDMGYLVQLWETIERASTGVKGPSLIYRERNLALRTIRDQLTDDIEECLIDDEKVHESALRFIRAIAPHQEPRIKLYLGDKPLFTRFNLEDQIETIYRRRVPLKSGGEIVIEPTEAMTAIDVNSSKSREASVEELAHRTNLEAAAEVARQLRLRDIGGLIVVDFIDMEQPKHLRAVEKVLLDAMRRDKAKFDVTRISKLGMLEISRQRIKAAKAAATYETCKACDGAGVVKTTEAAAISALRRIQTRVVRGDASRLAVNVPSDVALYLLNQQRDELQALERQYRTEIALVPRPDFPKEKCELEATPREGPALPPLREAGEREKGGRRQPREPREVVEAREPRELPEPSVPTGAAGPSAGSPPRRGPGWSGEEPGSGLERGIVPAAEEAPAPAGEGLAAIAGPRQGATAPATGVPGGVTPSHAHPAIPGGHLAPPPPAVAAGELGPEVTGDRLDPHLERSPWAGWQMGGRGIAETFDLREELGRGPAPPAGGAGETAAEEPAAEAPCAEVASGEVHAEGAEGGARKRRRRRGGRGRGRKEKLEEGAPAEPPVAALPEEVEDEGAEGLIVWEDAEEGEAPAPAGAGTARGAAQEHPADGSAAAHEAKRKRRKRGGRGRKKKGPDEPQAAAKAAGGEGRAPGRAPAAARKSPAERAPRGDAGAGAGTGAKKKRHRRKEKPPVSGATGRPGRGGGGAAPRGAGAGSRSAGAAGGSTRAGGRPGAAPPGEDGEEIPGGWWSRLLGPKKRPDRED